MPLVTETFKSPAEALAPRIAKATIVDQILKDLDTAIASLPDSRSSVEQGRVTKGAALALKARIALYNKRYAEAAEAAKTVIDGESVMGYSLHPDYGQLFTLAGQTSPEIILSMPCKDGFSTSLLPRSQGSRNLATLLRSGLKRPATATTPASVTNAATSTD